MTPQNTQAQIARWMGWMPTADKPPYWYIADDPTHEGDPRRLPDLTTFVGVAEWCAVVELEFTRRGWWVSSFTWENGSVDFAVYRVAYQMAESKGADKLAALTAAVLELMENKS